MPAGMEVVEIEKFAVPAVPEAVNATLLATTVPVAESTIFTVPVGVVELPDWVFTTVPDSVTAVPWVTTAGLG